jgi:hypothetical protein
MRTIYVDISRVDDGFVIAVDISHTKFDVPELVRGLPMDLCLNVLAGKNRVIYVVSEISMPVNEMISITEDFLAWNEDNIPRIIDNAPNDGDFTDYTSN